MKTLEVHISVIKQQTITFFLITLPTLVDKDINITNKGTWGYKRKHLRYKKKPRFAILIFCFYWFSLFLLMQTYFILKL